MSEPIFEPNEEPIDENRVEEDVDETVRPDDDTQPTPVDPDTGTFGGGQSGVPRDPGTEAVDLAGISGSDVEPAPFDPQATDLPEDAALAGPGAAEGSGEPTGSGNLPV